MIDDVSYFMRFLVVPARKRCLIWSLARKWARKPPNICVLLERAGNSVQNMSKLENSTRQKWKYRAKQINIPNFYYSLLYNFDKLC